MTAQARTDMVYCKCRHTCFDQANIPDAPSLAFQTQSPIMTMMPAPVPSHNVRRRFDQKNFMNSPSKRLMSLRLALMTR